MGDSRHGARCTATADVFPSSVTRGVQLSIRGRVRSRPKSIWRRGSAKGTCLGPGYLPSLQGKTVGQYPAKSLLLFSLVVRRRSLSDSSAIVPYNEWQEQWGYRPLGMLFPVFSNPHNRYLLTSQNFDRGTAIAEFIGLITAGIEGRDVMVGGSTHRSYQIYQGHMGNFTRFINHSCRANTQFQRFFWRGREHIVIVSRGLSAGSEITVDYSDGYWRQLSKNCLCGEPCCRFASRV